MSNMRFLIIPPPQHSLPTTNGVSFRNCTILKNVTLLLLTQKAENVLPYFIILNITTSKPFKHIVLFL